MRRVTLSHGNAIVFDLPPKGFDPLKASAADLARFGFPSVPEGSRHRSRLQRALQQLGPGFQMITPEFQMLPNKGSGPRRHGFVAGTEEGTIWSGAVVTPGSGGFKWIEGDWVVPNVAPIDDRTATFAAWIGIDGDGQKGSGDQVFQAGVILTCKRSGSSITVQCQPFWEWFPDPPVVISNFSVNPGDLLSVVLCSRNGPGSTEGTVFFANHSTGIGTSAGFSAPDGIALKGLTAEWVVEVLNDLSKGVQLPFPDYGEVFFGNCEAMTTSGTSVFGGTGDNIVAFGVESLAVLSEGILVAPSIVKCLYVGAIPPA